MGEVHEKAADLEASLVKNPDATIQDLAEEHELDEDAVVVILDSHFVNEDGKVENRGEGQGGNWAPARAAEAARIEELKNQIDAQIAERKTYLENLKDDADPLVIEGLEGMIAELEKQKADLG